MHNLRYNLDSNLDFLMEVICVAAAPSAAKAPTPQDEAKEAKVALEGQASVTVAQAFR